LAAGRGKEHSDAPQLAVLRTVRCRYDRNGYISFGMRIFELFDVWFLLI
jgi:hypothetical protein